MWSSPGNIYTLLNIFFSYQKNWNCSSEWYVALLCPCLTTLHGVLLHYCIPLNLLECIMQICVRSLYISKGDVGNARAAAEPPWQPQQWSSATVGPLRVGCGEHGVWAAGLPLAMQNHPSVHPLMVWTAASVTKRGNSPHDWECLNIVMHIGGGTCEWGNEPMLGVYRWADDSSAVCNAAPKVMCLIWDVWVSQLL